MEIITGYRGEPHITSAQDRAENQGTFGEGSYVLDVGNKLAATAVSATEIQIADGVLSHQGCLAIIGNGTYDTVNISNGTQGMNRIDLIVARYEKDSGTNVESMTLEVIEGTPSSSTPSAPAFNEGDIQNGDTPVDMPLYQVKLSGISVDSVDAVFATVKTQAEIDTLIGNANISGIGNGTVTGAISTVNSNFNASQTLQQDTYTVGGVGTIVYRTGRLCFITCVTGQWYCTANSAIRMGSASAAQWVISSGFRPKQNVEIQDVFSGKRITVDTSGNVSCGEALNGVTLRFSGCWINA